MCALFHSRVSEPVPALEPVYSDFPKIDGAEIAATTYGKRVAGEFYDSLCGGPSGYCFGSSMLLAAPRTINSCFRPRRTSFGLSEPSFFQGPISTNPKLW